MSVGTLTDIARRLLQNVEQDHGDLAEGVMHVPTEKYTDPVQYQREIEKIFLSVPLVVALSVDIPSTGNYRTIDLAGRAVVTIRGEDGVARAFVNACRHRGAPVALEECSTARRLACPYHGWVYDPQGALTFVPESPTFGDIKYDGLIPLPTAERAGIIFAHLDPNAKMDIDGFLGDMLPALQLLELDKLYRYEKTTTLESGNWKSTADGYLDGYHIGYLHSTNLGTKQICNRNTWDLFGPHVRLGFSNKTIVQIKDQPEPSWDLPEVMSLVHYIFPNVSISGQPGRTTMVSIIHPSKQVDRSTVHQTQYSRVPIDTQELMTELETRRKVYGAITGDEDFGTVLNINRALPAMGGTDFIFGRNESGNQNLHGWVDKLAGK